MLDLVILFGLFAAIAITIFSVGLADDSGATYKPEKEKYFMQHKAEESAKYFSNFGLQPASAYEAKREDKLNSDASSKVKYVEDPFSGGSLGDLIVELGPPLPAGYEDVKVVKGSPGTPGEHGTPGENGTDGIGTNGRNGEDGGGNGEDTFRKYFGRGSFIYAPNNNGNIATQGYASATGNQANEGSKVYAQATGHVFEGNIPDNGSTGALGNYSITAENLAGHVTNNLQGSESQEKTSVVPIIYGHNQETSFPFKKDNSEGK